MKNLHIENSYDTWEISEMNFDIKNKCYEEYKTSNAEKVLNRTYGTMHIEWWLHNIGYYITKPFCFINCINDVNSRFKHVDLEEWR